MFDTLSSKPKSKSSYEPKDNKINNENIKALLQTENNSLRLEIAELKKELDELQDSFRTRDAEEFQRVQVELELANKKCRVLQYRLMRIEKKNDELTDENARLQECYSLAQEQLYKVEELEDELVIAKEVSVRLHKELEESEQLRHTGENLNKSLKDSFDSVKDHIKNMNLSAYSDHAENRIFSDLYDSLYREHVLNDMLSKQSQEIQVLQSKHGTNRSEVDQKLALMHGYVCRLREAIDGKDSTIRSLTSKLQEKQAFEENKHEQRNSTKQEVQQAQSLLSSSSQSTPDLRKLKMDEFVVVNEYANQQQQQQSPTIASMTSTTLDSTSNHQQQQQHSRLLLWRKRKDKTHTPSSLLGQQSTATSMTTMMSTMPSTSCRLSDVSIQCEIASSSIAQVNQQKELQSIATSTETSNQKCTTASEIKNLRAKIELQSAEIEEMRNCFNDYRKLKQDLEVSLQEAGELIISRDSLIENIKEDNMKLRQQFSNEHNRMVKQIEQMDNELQACYREKAEVQQKNTDQLKELKELENSYYSLGQKLNNEVSELTKQITQLNTDKEKLEASFNSLRNDKQRTRNFNEKAKNVEQQNLNTVKKTGVDQIRIVEHEQSLNVRTSNAPPDANTCKKSKLSQNQQFVEKSEQLSESKTPIKSRRKVVPNTETTNQSKEMSGIPVPSRILSSNSKQISKSCYEGSQQALSASSNSETTMSQSLPPPGASKHSTIKKQTTSFNRWLSVASSATAHASRKHNDRTIACVDQNEQQCNVANRAQNILTKFRYHRKSSKCRTPANPDNEEKSSSTKKVQLPPSNIPRPSLKSPKTSETSSNSSGSITTLNNQSSPTSSKIQFGMKKNQTSSSSVRKDVDCATKESLTIASDVDSLLSRITSTSRPLMIDN